MPDDAHSDRARHAAGILTGEQFYDRLGRDYDLMVNWEPRLRREEAYLRSLVSRSGARKVLDAACGTGGHSLLLAGWGLEVTGVDHSDEMIRQARANAASSRLNVRFHLADLRRPLPISEKDFDLVICLGNTLPHFLTEEELRDALGVIRSVTAPGGVFMLQDLNYDRILARGIRYLPPKGAIRDGKDVVFLRTMEFQEGRTLLFNIYTLTRQESPAQES